MLCLSAHPARHTSRKLRLGSSELRDRLLDALGLKVCWRRRHPVQRHAKCVPPAAHNNAR